MCGRLRLSNHHLVGPAAAARAKFARNQVEAALASFQARALEALGGDWDAEKTAALFAAVKDDTARAKFAAEPRQTNRIVPSNAIKPSTLSVCQHKAEPPSVLSMALMDGVHQVCLPSVRNGASHQCYGASPQRTFAVSR